MPFALMRLNKSLLGSTAKPPEPLPEYARFTLFLPNTLTF